MRVAGVYFLLQIVFPIALGLATWGVLKLAIEASK